MVDINVFLRKGQLEPRAWWDFELWADSGVYKDTMFQVVSNSPNSWEKDGSEHMSVYWCKCVPGNTPLL